MPGWHVVENISTMAGVLGVVVMLFQGVGVPIIFAFPGMSVLTQYLMAKLHGLAGVFPLITTPVKTSKGFIFTRPVDLQAIRTHKRFNRT